MQALAVECKNKDVKTGSRSECEKVHRSKYTTTPAPTVNVYNPCRARFHVMLMRPSRRKQSVWVHLTERPHTDEPRTQSLSLVNNNTEQF